KCASCDQLFQSPAASGLKLIHGALNVIPQRRAWRHRGAGGMTETFQILILLLAVICLVGLVAKRLQIPPAILLVITGVVLALIPGLPSLQLAPDLVLLLVLPPVIYWDAVKMSWK